MHTKYTLIKTHFKHSPLLPFFFLIHFALILNIYPESKGKKREYQKNLARIQEFKRNMSKKERDYYEPRKKFIDKQSVKPSNPFFYQIDVILKGTALREKNRKNLKEIVKLEAFLKKADDFQLNRYFTKNEEIYLGMNAAKAIASIKKYAKMDENWRKKNDPVFRNYLKFEATKEEKRFYKKNKALFFRTETGENLIRLLQSQTATTEIPTKSKK